MAAMSPLPSLNSGSFPASSPCSASPNSWTEPKEGRNSFRLATRLRTDATPLASNFEPLTLSAELRVSRSTSNIRVPWTSSCPRQTLRA